VAFERERERFVGTADCTSRCIGDGDFDLSGEAIHAGWTIGAGFEWALHSSWSLKLEYNYYDFATERVALYQSTGLFAGFGAPADINPRLHAVTVGLNHRF
jgi:opacity protein-like surface antigen